ncbi:hypothetical protein CORC01_05890 [Colletotrichum orchidophilum]|uniref:Uncharacterized protein n=1 Tax=Colletotrichum orchidophilum TaxID=1209926 RepID=A0A1G4BBP9_9PEZI|nr:uncharacterized protein CORC01_05890 [Colletotrichum orchidophilum]OHE98801.1 hypothetical protein CORC01_05890 [Colletotrichum orchidophilum]
MRPSSYVHVRCACNGCKARRNNDARMNARTIWGPFPPPNASYGWGSGSPGANSSSKSDSDSEHVANSYATRLRPRPCPPTVPVTPKKTPRKGAAKPPGTPGTPALNDYLTETPSGA